MNFFDNIRYRRSDQILLTALAFMFVTAGLARFSFHDSHATGEVVLELVWLAIYFSSLAVLPVWAVIQALTNQKRSSRSVILAELTLAALWLIIGIWFLFGGPKWL